MSGKVDLLLPRKRYERQSWQDSGTRYLPVRKSLPFFRSANGTLIHRIRSGIIHVSNDVYSHTHFDLWCGMTGYWDAGGISATGRKQRTYNRSELFAAPPENAVCCATCEGRAIGAGLTESRVICGRFLVFSPRR